MSSEANLARSGAVSGRQAMLKSAAPDAAHPLAAIVTANSWDAGTTSRRHAK
jgi:hypothetical protein